MAVEVRMPAYSESMEEADVVGWLVAPGDSVNEGDPIAEIETDKATGELESPVSGVITQILVAEGSQGVKVGELLALIEPSAEATAGEPSAKPSPAAEVASEAGSEVKAEPEADVQPRAEREGQSQAQAVTQPDAQRETKTQTDSAPLHPEAPPVSATALARRLADRAGVELASIAGSGASGRVLKADVEAVSAGAPAARRIATPQPDELQAPAQLQLRVECRAEQAKAACEALSALEPDTPVPLVALIVRAAASALREVPQANLTWTADGLVAEDGISVALGVATPGEAGDGQCMLLHDPDRKSLAVLAGEIASGTSQSEVTPARQAALVVADVGQENVDSIQLSAAPPAVCALGTGAPMPRPVAVDGEVIVADVIYCTLAVDSRALDPDSAARLLAAFKLRFEDPLELLLS